METIMRAKMRVVGIEQPNNASETLIFSAVAKNDGYPADGSDENNTFARWTPSAELRMLIANPALIGKFTVGQEFYVDFTEAMKSK